MANFVFYKKQGSLEVLCYAGEKSLGFLECRIVPKIEYSESFLPVDSMSWVSKIKLFQIEKEVGYSNVQGIVHQFRTDLGFFIGYNHNSWELLKFEVKAMKELHEIIRIKRLLKI